MTTTTVYEACGGHLYVSTHFVPETRLDDRMLRLYHTRRRRWMRLRRRWLA